MEEKSTSVKRRADGRGKHGFGLVQNRGFGSSLLGALANVLLADEPMPLLRWVGSWSRQARSVELSTSCFERRMRQTTRSSLACACWCGVSCPASMTTRSRTSSHRRQFVSSASNGSTVSYMPSTRITSGRSAAPTMIDGVSKGTSIPSWATFH